MQLIFALFLFIGVLIGVDNTQRITTPAPTTGSPTLPPFLTSEPTSSPTTTLQPTLSPSTTTQPTSSPVQVFQRETPETIFPSELDSGDRFRVDGINNLENTGIFPAQDFVGSGGELGALTFMGLNSTGQYGITGFFTGEQLIPGLNTRFTEFQAYISQDGLCALTGSALKYAFQFKFNGDTWDFVRLYNFTDLGVGTSATTVFPNADATEAIVALYPGEVYLFKSDEPCGNFTMFQGIVGAGLGWRGVASDDFNTLAMTNPNLNFYGQVDIWKREGNTFPYRIYSSLQPTELPMLGQPFLGGGGVAISPNGRIVGSQTSNFFGNQAIRAFYIWEDNGFEFVPRGNPHYPSNIAKPVKNIANDGTLLVQNNGARIYVRENQTYWRESIAIPHGTAGVSSDANTNSDFTKFWGTTQADGADFYTRISSFP